MRITLLERDAERARVVAEKLHTTTVLHEEGLSREALIQSRVDEADAFVACAGDDRANLLAAINAKKLGADLCLSVVSREEFVPLVDALDIDAAFSPRLITAEAILRFVHGRALKAMHLLRSGFEVLEMEVEHGAPIAGRDLGHTGGLLAHCRVGAILRGEDVIVPAGRRSDPRGRSRPDARHEPAPSRTSSRPSPPARERTALAPGSARARRSSC